MKSALNHTTLLNDSCFEIFLVTHIHSDLGKFFVLDLTYCVTIFVGIFCTFSCISSFSLSFVFTLLAKLFSLFSNSFNSMNSSNNVTCLLRNFKKEISRSAAVHVINELLVPGIRKFRPALWMGQGQKSFERTAIFQQQLLAIVRSFLSS